MRWLGYAWRGMWGLPMVALYLLAALCAVIGAGKRGLDCIDNAPRLGRAGRDWR